MADSKTITIIGGGLAGLTLGIGLRNQRVPVIIFEAGHYPRHRVCGEFVSGRGQQILERLGIRQSLIEAGAISAQTAAFFSGGSRSPIRPLLPSALCLSRFKMDALLAQKFQALGGDLRQGVRSRRDGAHEAVVHANGRRMQPVESGWRWFGLKVHARNLSLDADLEMHSTANGYVGLCRLSDGEVNVCGLFRRRTASNNSPTDCKALLTGRPGSSLHSRLAAADFDENSFCSIAGLGLKPQRASHSNECRIGDALTMIPPVTGNGMSMAFESAAVALEPMAAYGRGEVSWCQAQQLVASACDARFARRLAWAKLLQWMMFAPFFRGCLAALPLHSEWLWRLMFARTR
jgi:2-polyprenyl-6-methoxyphenol hydroxylase-like FAD-dependent oxidoreductase